MRSQVAEAKSGREEGREDLMRSRGGICAFALIGLCAFHGWGAACAQGNAKAEPVAKTLVAEKQLSLPAGQEIPFSFRSALSSQRSKVGDPVEIVVVRDVKVDGLTVIAAGSVGKGRITAVKRRGHMGKPGRLEVKFSDVRTVDETPIRLAGEHRVSGEDQSEQVKDDAGSLVVNGLGFGAILIPFALLETGGSAVVEAGTVFHAVVANDVPLERASIEQHQPSVPPDKATIYVLHGDYLTCGSLLLIPGTLSSTVVKMEVPEGRYWFHAGGSINGLQSVSAAFLLGFTFGAVDVLPYPSTKKVLKRPVGEFLPLDVKAGQIYYVLGMFPGDHQTKLRVRKVEAAEAASILESDENPFIFLRDASPKMVHLLQAEPKGIRHIKK